MAGSRFAGSSRYSSGSKFAQGSRFAGAERGGGADISGTLPVLEQEAKAAGAPLPAQDSPGLFSRVADIISRPNYAVAGAAEELFSPQGKAQGVGHRGIAALKRAGTELFSGVGDLHGQKEGFGQVMEQAGVPALGHFSDIVPSIPVHTGFGGVMSVPIAGSPLDVTGRRAIGLGLDVVADPTLPLGFGPIGKSGKVASGFLTKTGGKLLAKETLAATESLSTRVAAIKALKAADATITSSAANTLIGRGTTAAPVLRDLAIKEAKDRVEAAIAGGAKGLLDKGGIKWGGMHIADNPLKALAESGVAKELGATLAQTLPGKAALASTAWSKKNLIDPVAHLFVKGYGIRGLEGAKGILDDAVNKEAYLKNLAGEDIAKSPFAPWVNKSDKEIEKTFRPVIDAYQKGGMAAVPQEFKPAMGYYAKKMEEMYGNEVAAGLLQRERKLVNYFAHYYKNDPDDLARVIYKQRGGLAGGVQGEVNRLLRLGRNAEERVYDTLADAERISKDLNAQNKTIPILEPVYNPIDSLTRRWEHSITKRVNREMTTALEAAHGPLPFKDVYDLATPVKYGANAVSREAVVNHILDVVPSKDKIAAVAKLPDDAKKGFFLERFKRIGSREEAAAVVSKYGQFEQYWPKRLVQADTDFAADGSRFIEFNPGQGSKFSVTLPETLANEVAGMSDHIVQSKAGRKILQGFDTLNNFWKGSVTWLFPSFHVRNAYSNVAQSFVDIGMHSLNPASYTETAAILFGKGEGTFKTTLGTYSYDEVRQILNRHGINTSARAIAEFTGNESKLLKPFKGVREAGTAIENESRAQLALNYLRRGMDPEDVGARVKNFQLDYSNGLTNFERQWMKRIVPFYAFQRLNLGLQLENMVKRPGMLAAEIKPFRGREDENAQMTSWDAGALKLRLNRDGKSVQMITGIDLPIRNLDLLFRGNWRDTFANAVGMLTPIAKVPIEVAANKSLFTGNDFDKPVNAPMAGRIVEKMPVAVQKWLGYDKSFDKAGRPQYKLDAQRYYLLGQSYATSRILSTADRQWREYLDKADGSALHSLLDLATGLRVKTMNMDEEMVKRNAERTKDLEKALIRWSQREEYRRTFKRKGQ